MSQHDFSHGYVHSSCRTFPSMKGCKSYRVLNVSFKPYPQKWQAIILNKHMEVFQQACFLLNEIFIASDRSGTDMPHLTLSYYLPRYQKPLLQPSNKLHPQTIACETLVGLGKQLQIEWEFMLPIQSGWNVLPPQSRKEASVIQHTGMPYARQVADRLQRDRHHFGRTVVAIGSEWVEKMVSMFKPDVAKRLSRRDELNNEYNSSFLCVCVDRKGLHWNVLAFFIKPYHYVIEKLILSQMM